jgi:hypothetical protein
MLPFGAEGQGARVNTHGPEAHATRVDAHGPEAHATLINWDGGRGWAKSIRTGRRPMLPFGARGAYGLEAHATLWVAGGVRAGSPCYPG